MTDSAAAPGTEHAPGSIFSACPISLWEEDVTDLLARLGQLRASGDGDLQGYLDRHPVALRECAGLIRVVAVNRATLELYEAPDEAALRAGLARIFTEESLPTFRVFVLALADGRSRCAAEGVTRTLRGRRIDADLTWSALPVGDDGRSRVLLSVVDRTEQRRIAADRQLEEEALRESQRTLETVVETAPSCVKLLTVDGTLQQMNRAGLAMIDAESLAQVQGRCIYPLVCEEHREAFEALVREVFAGGSGTLEFRMVGLKGRALWLYTHAVPLRDDAGQVVSLLAVTIDISDRKEAEERLRESERLIRNILDTVDEGFIVVDRDFRILTANRAYCAQIGGCPEVIVGRHCHEVTHRSSRPCGELGEECAVKRVFETGKSHAAAHRHTDRGGELLHVETKAFPIVDASGAVVAAIETLNNITERHLLEEERLKTQKLEAIGTLAGGIAHDFNNLLQGVFGYISLAKMSLEQRERCRSMLEQAEEALQLSVNLTNQLLTFSKGGKPLKRSVALRPVVENAAKFALSGSRSDCRLRFAEELSRVEADGGQLAQVIQNIVLNADQAMPDGGRVEIEARNVRAPGPGLPPQLGAGAYVEIAIRDNGIGVPAKYLGRIFDPYFTTKEKGSGLGLATSYSIVRNHGGFIEAASLPGVGSTFTIYLPAQQAGGEREAAPVAEAASGRSGSILVMDDEPLVLQVAAEQLRALGHEVDVAEDGATAVEKYRLARDAGRPFDAVILDLTVRGGMGGRETLERLLAVDPGVKAIISSGYSDDAVIAEHGEHGFCARLTKPYALERLRGALAELLA